MTTARDVADQRVSHVLGTRFAGCTSAPATPGSPLARFGVIADPQYADAPTHKDRYYTHSLDKLGAAAEALNGLELDFVVVLGDIIDHGWTSYGGVLPVLETLRAPLVPLLGNHDFGVGADLERLLAITRRRYFDFGCRGVRFIALDGNEVSLFATVPGTDAHADAAARLAALEAVGAGNARPWNGGISPAQFDWLAGVLERSAASGERVVILNHYPIWPVDDHNCWDDHRLVQLIAAYPQVVAYLNGHNHAGNYARLGSCHFVNFRGMVETSATNAFAVVELLGDRIEITGFGREPSRVLPL